MALARDAEATATFTTTATFNYSGNASAKAAIVLIHQSGTTDEISGITYGGIDMVRAGSNSESTEAGRVYIYYLLNPPQGTQQVIITSTGSTAKRYVVGSMTCAAGAEIRVAGAGYATGTSASIANPTWNITGLTASENVLAYEVIHSGLTTMTTTPRSSPAWTRITSNDLGAIGNGFAYISNTPSGTTLASGWTAATADDFVGASIAFREQLVVGDQVELVHDTYNAVGDEEQLLWNVNDNKPYIGSTSAYPSGVSSSSPTWAHTVPAGTTILVVMLGTGPNGSNTTTAVTWNGASLTKWDSTTSSAATSNRRAEIWYLLNPTPATGNVVVTNSAALPTGAVAVSLGNTDTTAPLAAAIKNSATTGTSETLTPVEVTDAIFLAMEAARGVGMTVSHGGGQTQIAGYTTGTSNNLGFDATYRDTAAASTFTWTTSDEHAGIGVAVKPPVGATTVGKESQLVWNVADKKILFLNKGATVAVTTSGSPAYPGSIAAGNMLRLVVASFDSTITGTYDGWTPGPTVSGGGVNDYRIYYKSALGTESGTVAVTTAAGTGGFAYIDQYVVPSGYDIIDVVASNGATDTTSGTGFTATHGSVTTSPNDTILMVSVARAATTFPTYIGGSSITQTGATLQNFDFDSGEGRDSSATNIEASSMYVESGATATVNHNLVLSAAGTGASLMMVVRGGTGVTTINKDSQIIYKVLSVLSDQSQLIHKTRSLTFDTSQLIYNTYILAYDSFQLIHKTRALAFDTSQLIYNTYILAYDSFQLIHKTLVVQTGTSQRQLIHKTRTIIGDSSQIIHNSRTLIYDSLQSIYKTRALAGDSSQLINKTRALGSDTLQIIYNVRFVQTGASQRQLIHRTRALAGDSSQIIHNSRALVYDSSQLIHKTRALAGDSSQLIHRTRALAGDSSQFVYNIRVVQTGTSQRQLIHKTRALAGDSSQIIHNSRALVYDSSQIIYNIRGATFDALQLIYKTRALASDTSQLIHKTRAIQTGTSQRQLIYNTRTLIYDSSVLSYNTNALAYNTVQLVYKVLYGITLFQVGQNSTIQYNSRSIAYDISTIQYNSRATLYDSVQIIHNVHTFVSDSSSLFYNTRHVVYDSASLLHSTRTTTFDSSQIIYKTWALAHDISQLIYKTRAFAGDSSQLIHKTRALAGDSSRFVYMTSAIMYDQFQFVYNVRVVQTGTSQRQLIHRTRALAGDTGQLIYKTHAVVGDNSMIVYNVLNLNLSALGKNSQIIHNTRAITFDTSQLIYHVAYITGDLSQLVYKTRTLASDSEQIIYNTHTSLYDSLQFIYNIRIVAFDISQLIHKTRSIASDSEQIRYNTRTSSYDSVQLIYKTRVTQSGVSQQQILHNTRGLASNSEQLIYNSRMISSDSLMMIYRTRISIGSDSEIIYNVALSITAYEQITYNTLIYTGLSIVLLYKVLSHIPTIGYRVHIQLNGEFVEARLWVQVNGEWTTPVLHVI